MNPIEDIDEGMKIMDGRDDRTLVENNYPELDVFEKGLKRQDLRSKYGEGLERRLKLLIHPIIDIPRKMRVAQENGGSLNDYMTMATIEMMEIGTRVGLGYVAYK